VLHPGKLQIAPSASFVTRHLADTKNPDGHPKGKPIEAANVRLPLTVKIKTPDGQPFAADHVTLSDLKRFRDLRGTSQGFWTFSISGESRPINVDDKLVEVTPNRGRLRIAVKETVSSKSAPPLVNDTLAGRSNHRYSFDLFRVGMFSATARLRIPFVTLPAHRTMKLRDPDGVVVATSNNGRLRFPVTLETLDKSRDAQGVPRLWSLEVLELPSTSANQSSTIFATVIESAHIPTSVLQERIDFLIGKNGNKLSIFGERRGSDLCACLKILDAYSAETIDMHGLFDSVIQPPTSSVEANTVYTVASADGNFSIVKIFLHDMKVSTIKIELGPSEKIEPAIPALKLEVQIEGHASADVGDLTVATMKLRHNPVKMEAGLRLNADGSFSPETWIEDDLLDIEISNTALAALAAVPFIGLAAALTASEVADALENKFNELIPNALRSVMTSAMRKVPEVLAFVLGDDFTYRSLRFEEGDIVFDYVAPLEPEPKPSPGYSGIIGRSATEVGPDIWQVTPPSLGDTWKADNLAKIEHIVVVMMENRSFDHVLGYRASLPDGKNSDGLSHELIGFLKKRGFSVGKLNGSKIKPNRLGFRTRFPSSVGHELSDVSEQLSKTIRLDSGRLINSPEGFISNFAPKATKYSKEHPNEIISEDVLGYYEASDLPFFNFLAENYSYCEKFYSSHPGPTLPNRMFSLTGDLQFDRVGEIIPDTNNGDNFALSRATTIYDLLTRKRIGWRVYESFPSVTMLRMFARYATDNTNIRPLARLEQDIAHGDLLAVTVVEPAMHHSPQDDDHSPRADMYDGQRFVQRVYKALRLRPELWKKTMLVVTYDEHGGFYDHVIPPLAEIRTRLHELSNPKSAAAVKHFTASTLKTNFGLRVPTFVVSPWAPVGKGPDLVLDFCSILKTILARFCGSDKPFLSDRVNASISLDAYLSEDSPRMNVPNSPPLPPLPVKTQNEKPAIVTEPISRKRMRAGKVDFHELTGMLARMLGR
jgi:phospholipase C